MSNNIKKNNSKNQALNFQKYESEIVFDTYDALVKSKISLIEKTVLELGYEDLHHIIKYHYKITLNSIFFDDKSLLKKYHEWLYRVYYFRNIDLDFFLLLTDNIQNIAAKYVESCVFYNYLLEIHKTLKNEASKKRVLLDNEQESVNFADLLINNEKEKAFEILKANSSVLEDFLHFYNETVSNSMKQIGFLWERNEISVAKEHIASNLLDQITTDILNRFKRQEPKNKHIFICSAPYELHGLGIKTASKVFEIMGYKVTNLGTYIPKKDIKKAIFEFNPDYILFTATMPTSLIDIALIIDDINKEKEIFLKNFKIGLAGSAFETILHPCKSLKADFYINKLEDLKC